jgi:hypothetical protein
MKRFIYLIVLLLILGLFIVMAMGCTSDATVTPKQSSNDEIKNGQEVSDIEEVSAIEDSNGNDLNDNDSLVQNSRQNPAGLNETFIVEMDDWLVGRVTFEIEMIEVISGDKAWQVIKAGNQFNDPPGEGKEYIMAKFRVKVLETEEDEPFSLMMIYFSCISGSGVEYTDFVSVAGVVPTLWNDLYEGAEHAGWEFFMVDKDDDKPVVAMERKTPAEVWFDLRVE